jgi:ABC-type multidrug transport system fused ATPase/permease subunit
MIIFLPLCLTYHRPKGPPTQLSGSLIQLIGAESTEGKNVLSKTIKGYIRLENVCFSYPTCLKIQVVRGLSLTVEP